MAETFDAFRYISYLRSRWRWILASCAIAVALAGAWTLAQSPQYTATARLVIDPPAGTDLRSAMAVSPIYLESLRTYEHFADSDSLFQKAVDRFDLRSTFNGRPIESVKRRVLKIAVIRNTRILEIAATLPDPRKAHELAQFVAESTVELNRSLVSEGDQDLVRGIEQQEQETRARLEGADAAWAKLAANEPVEDLEAAIEKTAELRSGVQQQILGGEVEIADMVDREKRSAGAALEDLRKEQANARARVEALRRELDGLNQQAIEREKLLAVRLVHREKLEAERKAEETALAAIEARLREARGDAGYRGERLRIIDPGIVPERPSAPNLPLNTGAALLLGLILSLGYLTVEMSYQERRASGRRSVYHAVVKARDD